MHDREHQRKNDQRIEEEDRLFRRNNAPENPRCYGVVHGQLRGRLGSLAMVSFATRPAYVLENDPKR